MGETVTIRFTYVTDEGNSNEEVEGWTIDDVRIIDRFQVKNTACVYSADASQIACDNIADGGTLMYNHYGVSVAEIEEVSFAHLYPNPAQDECTVSLAGLWSDDVQVVIYDVQGKVVLSETQSNLNFSIQTKDFANGLYFVELTDGTNKLMKKLTVVH
jgi:hypothetical protein